VPGRPAFTYFKPGEFADDMLSSEEIAWADNGALVLTSAPAAKECTLVQVVEFGDRHTLIAEVTDARLNRAIEGRPDEAVLHMKDRGEKVFYGGSNGDSRGEARLRPALPLLSEPIRTTCAG